MGSIIFPKTVVASDTIDSYGKLVRKKKKRKELKSNNYQMISFNSFIMARNETINL